MTRVPPSRSTQSAEQEGAEIFDTCTPGGTAGDAGVGHASVLHGASVATRTVLHGRDLAAEQERAV